MKAKKLHLPSKTQVVSGFVLVTRLALGCMFIMSSLPKIQLPLKFLSDVYGYELVGPKLGVLVAMTLSWLELLVGICLVGGIFVSGALLASAGMGAMFAVVLASALIRGLDISCGCFGMNSGKINYLTLIRAVVILLVSGLAYMAVILRDRTEPGV
jgi:putative oxidoreductase